MVSFTFLILSSYRTKAETHRNTLYKQPTRVDGSFEGKSLCYDCLLTLYNTGPSLYTSAWSPYISFAPNPPTGLVTLPLDEATILLSWLDNSSSETGFIIERSDVSGARFTELITTIPNSTTYKDSCLADGRTYFYRVRSTNGSEVSAYSNESRASTVLATPSKLSAVAKNDSVIHLTWEDNSVSETGYIIERSDSSGTDYNVINVVPPNFTAYTDIGFKEGDQYFYRIRTTNGLTHSEPSNESETTTLLAAPTELEAIMVDDTTINLMWTDRSDFESGFSIERSETSKDGFTEVHTSAVNETFYTDRELTDGMRYYYRIRASNQRSTSCFSNETWASTPLSSPTGMSTNAIDEGTIHLIWTDQSLNELGYVIERSLSSGSDYKEIQTTSANSTEYTDMNLIDGMQYFYRVRATKDSIDSDYSNESSATTKLAAPSELSAICIDESLIQLSWTDNSANESGFCIERSENSGTGFSEINFSLANSTSFIDEGMTKGIYLFYRIRAINPVTYSIYSSEASFVPNMELTYSLFRFYPNPNRGYVNMEIYSEEGNYGTFYVRLADLAGTIHFFEEIKWVDGKQLQIHEFELPPSISNGTYTLSVITGKSSVSQKFLLVMKQ